MTANHHETCGVCHASGSCYHASAGHDYQPVAGMQVCARCGMRSDAVRPKPCTMRMEELLNAEHFAHADTKRDLVSRQSEIDRLTAEVARMQGERDTERALRLALDQERSAWISNRVETLENVNGHLRAELAGAQSALARSTQERDTYALAAAARGEEAKAFKDALTAISAIRDSIVGTQSINWSEHIYPLIAALGRAGFEGAGYEIARANMGTLIDRANAADTKARGMELELEAERERGTRQADLWSPWFSSMWEAVGRFAIAYGCGISDDRRYAREFGEPKMGVKVATDLREWFDARRGR